MCVCVCVCVCSQALLRQWQARVDAKDVLLKDMRSELNTAQVRLHIQTHTHTHTHKQADMVPIVSYLH